MSALNILSGGAAQGLVGGLTAKFRVQTGLEIAGEFGAVGAMANKLREGILADLVILTSALIATLVNEDLADGASVEDVGKVETALAVRERDPLVSVSDVASLRATFLAADAIFVPDTKASTAGIHVAKVLRELGIADEVANRLKVYPSGTTAMRQMAESDANQPIGCTQATEIIATSGIRLSGSLPKGCDLATRYTAAITKTAARPREAKILIDLLAAKDCAALRAQAGFLEI